jgi:hypothetical protein
MKIEIVALHCTKLSGIAFRNHGMLEPHSEQQMIVIESGTSRLDPSEHGYTTSSVHCEKIWLTVKTNPDLKTQKACYAMVIFNLLQHVGK